MHNSKRVKLHFVHRRLEKQCSFLLLHILPVNVETQPLWASWVSKLRGALELQSQHPSQCVPAFDSTRTHQGLGFILGVTATSKQRSLCYTMGIAKTTAMRNWNVAKCGVKCRTGGLWVPRGYLLLVTKWACAMSFQSVNLLSWCICSWCTNWQVAENR